MDVPYGLVQSGNLKLKQAAENKDHQLVQYGCDMILYREWSFWYQIWSYSL